MTTNIYLNTAFVFMACDGEIVQEEIELIKKMNDDGVFSVENIDDELKSLTDQLNSEGKNFMKAYLQSIEDTKFNKEDALKLLKIAIKAIFVDNNVEYSEVKFFRAVRKHLHNIEDEYILDNIIEIEDFWLESDIKNDVTSVEKDYFDNIELPHFDLFTVKDKEE